MERYWLQYLVPLKFCCIEKPQIIKQHILDHDRHALDLCIELQALYYFFFQKTRDSVSIHRDTCIVDMQHKCIKVPFLNPEPAALLLMKNVDPHTLYS